MVKEVVAYRNECVACGNIVPTLYQLPNKCSYCDGTDFKLLSENILVHKKKAIFVSEETHSKIKYNAKLDGVTMNEYLERLVSNDEEDLNRLIPKEDVGEEV